MKPLFKNILLATSAIALLGFAGCTNSKNSKTDALEQAKPLVQESADSTKEASANAVEAEPEKAEEKVAEANIIRKQSTVKNRGGFVRISVNNNPITNFDIKRREKFLRLRNERGNRSKVAEKEMIEQILKLQEATRRRTIASDEQVDQAFATFASRNRTNSANLSRELGRLGIGASHFKEFIRTQISWQRTVQARFQSETKQVTEQDAIIGLRSSGSEKPELTEYSLKQIVFVVPKNKRSKSALSARRVEANAFRQKYTGCDNAIVMAKALRDVSVIDQKRVLEPVLPSNWKDAIIAAGASGITKVQETPRGIELLAVCSKRQVQDDNAAKVATQAGKYDVFGEQSSKLSNDYLNELRSKATIIYQ